jgi:hypothetical protein
MVVLVVGTYERFLFGFNSPGLAPGSQAVEDAAVGQVQYKADGQTYFAKAAMDAKVCKLCLLVAAGTRTTQTLHLCCSPGWVRHGICIHTVWV